MSARATVRRVTVSAHDLANAGFRHPTWWLPRGRRSMAPDDVLRGGSTMSRRRTLAVGAGIAAATAALRRRKTRVPTDPFDPDAVRAETAAVRAAELVARPQVRRADLALTFAPAIATAVDPLLHGHRYFPRILEDIAAAKDHVHLLIYGYKPGDIGTTFLEALSAKVARGRRGPAGGRRHRQRGRPRQQGPVPAAARGRRRGRRARRHRGRAEGRARSAAASSRMPRTCSISTTARWSWSTAGSATSAAAASRTTTTTSGSTTSCAGSRGRSSRSWRPSS